MGDFFRYAIRDSLSKVFTSVRTGSCTRPRRVRHDSNPFRRMPKDHPEWDGLLARDKGFEPLTFWSVDRVYPFYGFSQLAKKSDFMRVSEFGPFVASHHFWPSFARLFTKCARNFPPVSLGYAVKMLSFCYEHHGSVKPPNSGTAVSISSFSQVPYA